MPSGAVSARHKRQRLCPNGDEFEFVWQHPLRAFLDLPGDMQQASKEILLARPINMRREKPAAITVAELDSVERAVFEEYAQPINRRLYS